MYHSYGSIHQNRALHLSCKNTNHWQRIRSNMQGKVLLANFATQQSQSGAGDRAARSKVDTTWNYHRTAYLPEICMSPLPRCQQTGMLFVATSTYWGARAGCGDTCHLSPDRVRTQSAWVSPGFKRRPPILRGHRLPGLLCSCSQRLAQYAEWEYTGKSAMHTASLSQQ